MIFVTGSLAFDQILDFPGKFTDHILPEKLHSMSISFLVEKMRKGFGGTAGNIAYTISLLGEKVAVGGMVGEDFEPYFQFLEKSKVITDYIKTVNNQFTSTAIGITDAKDNQIWGFHTGADSFSQDYDLGRIKNKIKYAIIAPQNPKAMLNFAQFYSKNDVPFLFDPGMQLPYFSKDDLKRAFKNAKIIIGNDYEVSVMEKKTGIDNLNTLSQKGKIIITTLGEKGSIISKEGDTFKIPPAKVASALDPAGAGDCYRSGFIVGYLKKLPIEVCGRMGSIASAYSVEKYGTTSHYFTLHQFKIRYLDNFGKKLDI